MARQITKTGNTKRATEDMMHGLRELAQTIHAKEPLRKRFTVRTVSIPEPGRHTPAAVKKLRLQLGMSQAIFAELLGVSRIWLQGWERGVRTPSPLARRLLDTVRANPSLWLAMVWKKAG